jgi:hypothetical protein
VPADINGDIVRSEYIALSDVHRRLFDWPSVAYLLNPAAFAGVSGLLLWSAWRRQRAGVPTKADTHLGWIVLLGGLAWLVIYAAGVVQANFGSLPDLVATLMPYRLSNVTALLLIPLAVSGIAAAGTHRLRARPVIWAALGLLLVVVGVRVGADRDSVFRNGLYIILGAFLAVQSRSSVASVGVLAVLGAIAWKLGLRHEVAYLLGTWAIVLAFLVISEIPLRVRAVTPKILRLAAATVLALGCIATTVAGSISPSVWNSADMLFDANGNPSVPWDAMSPYDQALGDWLRTNSAPNDLILSAVWPRSELQAKVGHPVLFELETLPLMTYLPSVAGSTGVLARDLYGLDYSQPDQLQLEARSGQLNLDDAVWSAAWMTRSRGEWHALAQKYSFHLVLAPTQTRLDLPVALPGPVWTLYTIP